MLLSTLLGFGNQTSADASLFKSVGLDMATLFHLYMIISFLSLVVHFLQLLLSFTNLFIRLISFLVWLVVALFMLQVNAMVFLVTLPVKTLAWLNDSLGTKVLLVLLLSIAAYVYFVQMPAAKVPDLSEKFDKRWRRA